MCGIAGLIHRGRESNVGNEMTSMLQALKHRGPDSTGYAVYSEGVSNEFVMRIKVAEAEDMASGRGIFAELAKRIAEIDAILDENGVTVKFKKNAIGRYRWRTIQNVITAHLIIRHFLLELYVQKHMTFKLHRKDMSYDTQRNARIQKQ